MPILNPDHLLEQAHRLIAGPSAGPPRQVDIRRAISTAYYAVFHDTLIAAADSVAGRAHRGTARYALVYRGIDHQGFRSVLDLARRPVLPAPHRKYAPPDGFSPAIREFAAAGLSLQERRHTADYDPMPRFRAADAILAIAAAEAARSYWRDAPVAEREILLWLMLFRPR